MTVEVDDGLTVEEVRRVARGHEEVALADAARERVAASRDAVESILEEDDRRVYGVNTGLGDLQSETIPRESLLDMQENIVHSHAASVGETASTALVRASILARVSALAQGRSGVRVSLVESLCALLNEGVHPRMHLEGSTDDLAAMAHVPLVLVGEGRAEYDGTVVDGREALDRAGIEPVTLQPKEGLATITGTPVTTGGLALAVEEAGRVVDAADLAGALSFSAVGSTPEAFDERPIEARPHEGHAETAANLRSYLPDAAGSDEPAQDPLSMRLLPQIHGTVRQHVEYARDVVETELASATGNPLVFPDGETYSCGNFAGQPLSSAADMLAGSSLKLGRASRQRTDELLENDGCPFLARNPGTESGMMIAQYTSAGLLAERGLVDGVSSDSVSVSAGQEDVHSMGTVAVRNLRETLESVRRILAIELLCGVRWAQLADPEPNLGKPLAGVVEAVGDRVPDGSDEGLQRQIEDVACYLGDGEFFRDVEGLSGEGLR